MQGRKHNVITPLRRKLLPLGILPVLLTAVVLTIAAASVSLKTAQGMLESQLQTVAFMLSCDETRGRFLVSQKRDWRLNEKRNRP